MPRSQMPGSSIRPGMPHGGVSGVGNPGRPGAPAGTPGAGAAGAGQAPGGGAGPGTGTGPGSGASSGAGSGRGAGLGSGEIIGGGPGGIGGEGIRSGGAMGAGMGGAMGAGMNGGIGLMPTAPLVNAPSQAIATRTPASTPVALPFAEHRYSTAPATSQASAAPLVLPSSAAQHAASAGTAATAVHPVAMATPQPIPFRRTHDSIFDVASPPFIEGDFVAAARQPDGTWLAVAPQAEPFPNAWQMRVMLWFALSLAIVSPLAWLFVRRIVLPLRDFAQAAEQLGRDPSATILPLSGPAEIGRAANAFNQMRNRLRAFVDDRTAMVGAISHDLRTPLTRLRFRIEDVPDEQREGLLKEVTEMEAMISQVIAFIRDASTPGARQRMDFADLIAGSVADWQLVGANVEIESSAHIPVEVDPVGIRRLLANLLENAVKYGTSARVRVSLTDGEAVAEIVDAGPGIPEEEFDRAFEPFYRSEAARRSGRTGSGLGLAVCRSIARAHGGDVSFSHGRDGFVARVSVPAAFDPTLRKAA
jgi:signal transduction histidine kinase